MLSVFESEKKLKDIAMAIMRSSEFMESIIKRVLFFVEIENTSLTENEIVFDAKELAGRLSVVYAKPCNLAIQAEPAKIKYWQEIAAEELIANAIKFCDKEEAKVSVIIDADRIIVEDNGPGIPAGEYKKVFEPFYQINKSNTGNTAGLGIGLSIVKRLCESANMRVKLEKSFDGGLKVAIGRY
jgi:signal transduction histidine kinase